MSTDLQRSLAMFRFNFWAKPFFTPPPGSGGMETAPPFVPNPLTSPALMVLASTAAAEGHEVQRLQAAQQQQQQQHSPHHPSYPGRGMDKDLPPPPPPPPFSSAAFMYRPGDPFSAPLYFVRPELNRRLALVNPPMHPGAFRPLTPSGSVGGDVDVPQAYHSAFSLTSAAPSSAKKSKHGESSPGVNSSSSNATVGASTSAVSSTTTSSSSDHHHPHRPHGAQFPDHGHQQHDDRSPSLGYRGEGDDGQVCSPGQHGGAVKEERPASLCSSQGYDTVSEPMSDSGDAYERGTPDSEGRSLRMVLAVPRGGFVSLVKTTAVDDMVFALASIPARLSL
ncbi:E3 ubiquitin-protein ligase Rnf220-like isoform X2 [Elysia marginata]|uniref:E3 ubiquitin-protein ligase Rnf220-like isoform X2 n=1 Tax=Elysia marginata TaxID=1093978 RepID=A0AAV4GA53_9GAST|nr:E3 ubiquitin-protein ligase Rnf220-like isoform X2 [Elysia marginata]